MTRLHKQVLGLTAVLGAVLIGASAAWACTNSATLNLSQSTGPAGSELTVSGTGFATDRAPVSIHLSNADGTALGTVATVTPDAGGVLAPVAVHMPANAVAGYYAISATQAGQAGQTAAGLFQVTSPTGQPATHPAPVNAGGHGLGTGILVVLAVLGALAVAGLGLLVGRRRKDNATAPAELPIPVLSTFDR